MEEPIVYMKVPNEQGAYIDKDGVRWDILTCHHTESKEQVQVGTTTKEIDGEIIEVPVYQSQVVINKGWDSFESIEEAMEAYGVEEYHKPVIEEAIDVPAEVVEEEQEEPEEVQPEIQETIDTTVTDDCEILQEVIQEEEEQPQEEELEEQQEEVVISNEENTTEEQGEVEE